ncbi:MAG: ceramidase domain-containing protein [Myxococcota bacterium]|jgi:hypothetical protein
MRRWPSPELLVTLAASLAGLGALTHGASLGFPGAPFNCADALCYCEATSPGAFRQPINTWSNLVPLAVALWVAARAGRERRGRTTPNTSLDLLGWLFPLMLVSQGLGSMAFHASLTEWGAALDAMSMFTTSGLLLATNLLRLGRLAPRGAVTLWLVLIAAGYLTGVLSSNAVMLFVFLLFLSVLFTEVWLSRTGRTRSHRFFRAGLAVFVGGVALWYGSAIEGAPLCWPDSWLQVHALWHVTSAAAMACFYRHATGNLAPVS